MSVRVLVGCEESGRVRRAFRGRGHDAWSCDLEPARDNSPYHLQADVMTVLDCQWDVIILHPSCQYLAVCGNRWYAGTSLRDQAIQWTLALWDKAISVCNKVVLENPASVIWPHMRKKGARVQFIQPHQFGHPETKKTGLALHGLPDLNPTDDLLYAGFKQENLMHRVWKATPSETRSRDRSTTYLGVADAFAEQYGAT